MTATTQALPGGIKTKFLIISDTHGLQLPIDIDTTVDVAIHCGDLTEHSKLDEFRAAIRLMDRINAPLKLVIAGNHDFSLDVPVFKQKICEAKELASEPFGDALIKREFGEYGAARTILQEANDRAIVFLDEGSHQFHLENGALLKVFASPYTPSTNSASGWGFQYSEVHKFDIHDEIDVVITHGPPLGIMDISSEKKRIGCPQLFAAIAKAQPLVHCFGHTHEGWGAKLVTWRPQLSDTPSHFTDIDNDKSHVIETLLSLKGSEFESMEERKLREDRSAEHRMRGYCRTSHCGDDMRHLENSQTLFVNAAVKGHDGLDQLPWVVDIELPPTATT
ncbi:metallophosphoesterase domain-containing 1 [Trichoderma arundinaceum]|uniref:Metallophosphoesterase domain-containing 1 n=1 Tax=Trichoderma arundinaceum TaxID=490622 RepID=A0A395NJ77_TRIAR|nr:metallophosphoesterase domain-containing 1 [Trichoderma arundinaceum]